MRKIAEGENGELAEKVEANDDVQLYWSKLGQHARGGCRKTTKDDY